MHRLFEKVEKMTLPTLILRGLVVFPDIPISFEVNRPISKKALDKAGADDNLVFLVTQMDISVEEPNEEHIYRVGTIAKIKQVLKLPENNLRVLVEGVGRAELVSMEQTGGAFYSSVMQKNIFVEDNGGLKGEALVREARGLFERYTRHLPKVSGEFAVAVQAINNPGQLADFIAANIILKYEQKQQILSEFDPMRRLELLCIIMESEDEILSLEPQIHRKVKGQLDRNHRDYYLREQLKVIQNELGGGDGDD
ncbi:MAG: LON peptidase substrate-binding domain-containing protein, partial [Patescibacteria group bacterium]|nr:LON peptidase substrate-binding domain-containing protein [Patescibacteria group bacterium]